MKKTFFLLLAVISISLFLFNPSSAQVKSKDEQINEVMDLAWDNFNVLAASDLKDDSVLFFDVANTVNRINFIIAVFKNA